MTITARIVEILPVETGTSKSGRDYKRQTVVLETDGRYPKKIAVQMMNDVCDKFTGRVGQTLTAHVEPSSREYNGRWYTQIDVWKWEGGNQNGTAPAQTVQAPAASTQADQDLPF